MPLATSWIPAFSASVLRRKVRVFVISLVVLTVLGPFGTYDDFDIPHRAAYWMAILILSSPIFEITVPGFLYSPRLTRRFGHWPRFIFGVLTSSFFVVWVVFGVEHVARAPIDLVLWPLLFFYVGVIGMAISFVSFMAPFARAQTSADAGPIDFERIAFFDTYPHLRGRRLRWITMQDHYARVVLHDGEVTLHASMYDLEKQLQHYPGSRVHRSHWVAHDAIHSVERHGRATMIDVGDNIKLPLGGSYQKQVEVVLAETARHR